LPILLDPPPDYHRRWISCWGKGHVRGLGACDPPALCGQLLAAVAEYRGPAPAADDETLLVLHHNAADPPQPTVVQRINAMAHMIGLGRH
jgi:hypothetical protein